MDIRRLHAFAKIVDIGSITRASVILNIAQPALSQQIAALETHFGKPLLVRSKRGVVPTEAGKVLYRHCQIILKQMDQAELEVTVSTEELSGFVSVGIAALSLGPVLATRFLVRAREEFPGIVLYINESVGGGAISEQIMAGKMDMALIYDPGDLPGLSFEQVRTEELFLVTRRDLGSEADEVTLEEAVAEPLILPSRVHTVRQVLETALIRSRLKATVVAHTESISVLAGGIQEGLGGTILPYSAALSARKRLSDARIHRIRKPNMKVTMAICTSAQLPQSEPARAIQSLLVELSEEINRPVPTI